MEHGDNPYQILGVTPTASHDDIRKSYRKLAMKSHPDRQKTDVARDSAQHVFARISNAYEIVGDEDRRRVFDRDQREAVDQGAPQAEGFDVNTDYDVPTADRDTDYTLPELENGTGSSMPRFAKKQKAKKKAKKGSGGTKFSDPYDVFKRSFEEEFGMEYPGAKYDYVEAPTNTPRLTSSNKLKAIENGESEQSKNKGGTTFFRNPFRKRDPSDETQLAVRGKNRSGRSSENQVGRYDPKKNPNDNRPTSMETSERTIKHKDGKKETITEIKIKRPDGSTETCRQTNNVAISKEDWNLGKTRTKAIKGEEKPRLQLTNGKKKAEAPKQLTNGKNKMFSFRAKDKTKDKTTNKKLTNGKQKQSS